MYEKLSDLATFEVSLGGVPFVVRRRTTELMLQIGDARSVFGLIRGAISTLKELESKEEATLEDLAKAQKLADSTKQQQVDMQKKAAPLIIVSIGGESVSVEEPPPWEYVGPLMDVLFAAFLGSALSADPTPDSLPAPKE